MINPFVQTVQKCLTYIASFDIIDLIKKGDAHLLKKGWVLHNEKTLSFTSYPGNMYTLLQCGWLYCLGRLF